MNSALREEGASVQDFLKTSRPTLPIRSHEGQVFSRRLRGYTVSR